MWRCINNIHAFDVITGSRYLTLALNPGGKLRFKAVACVICLSSRKRNYPSMSAVYHFYSSHGQSGYPAFRWQRWRRNIKNKKCFSMLFMCFCSINWGRRQLMKLFTVPVALVVVLTEPCCCCCWVRSADKFLNETNKPGSLTVALWKVPMTQQLFFWSPVA